MFVVAADCGMLQTGRSWHTGHFCEQFRHGTLEASFNDFVRRAASSALMDCLAWSWKGLGLPCISFSQYQAGAGERNVNNH